MSTTPTGTDASVSKTQQRSTPEDRENVTMATENGETAAPSRGGDSDEGYPAGNAATATDSENASSYIPQEHVPSGFEETNREGNSKEFEQSNTPMIVGAVALVVLLIILIFLLQLG